MKRKQLLLLLYLVILLLSLTSPALAETGATYDLSWWTVDSGGATSLTSGTYTLSGTAGQPDAGSLASGDYDLAGGFWQALISELQNFLPFIRK
jgi:hypothetical protein